MSQVGQNPQEVPESANSGQKRPNDGGTSKYFSRRKLLKAGGVIAGGALAFPFVSSYIRTRAAGTPLPVSTASDPWNARKAILANIQRPVFSNRIFLITNYGAVGDGTTDNTAAFRKAIAACSHEGGGMVLVPPGTFLTGAIHLLSNVNLHVEAGATIKFSQDPAAYLPVVYTRWQGIELMNYSPFIYAYKQKNVAITGQGTLDGQADNQHWWPWKGLAQFGWTTGQPNENNDWTLLQNMADQGVPVAQRVFGSGHYLRPAFIQPYLCTNVLIEGVTILHTPMWQMNPVLSQNVLVDSVTPNSLGPNNDGCDPESCNHVLIQNCSFNTGDDCIAIKSGRNTDGRRVNVPSQNIIIYHCTFQSGHGGVTVGSEMTGGVQNVFAYDCQMTSPSLQTALRFKTNSVRGGFIKNIYARNIQVGQVSGAAIDVNYFYGEGNTGTFPPLITNIDVQNLTVGQCAEALSLQGYPNDPIGTVKLTNCTFTQATGPNIVSNVKDLELHNVFINGQRVG